MPKEARTQNALNYLWAISPVPAHYFLFICLFEIGSDQPGTCCVDQAGIKFTVNLGLPGAGIKKRVLPCLALLLNF